MPPKQRAPWVNIVSPGWFRTFGMRILQGRDFDERDSATAAKVLVVNESFARRFFPDGSALGQEIKTGLEGPTVHNFRIVGVVSDSVYSSLRKGFEPIVFAPLAQLEDVSSSTVITGPLDCFTTAKSGESMVPNFGGPASFAA